MTNVLESFIDNCDELLLPAQEGLFQSIKNAIKKSIYSILSKIEHFLQKRKETNFRARLLDIISKLKSHFEIVDKCTSTNELDVIQNDVSETNKEVNYIICSEDAKEFDPHSDKSWNKVPSNIKKIILSKDVQKARHLIISNLSSMNSNPSNREIETKKWKEVTSEIKCIKYFFSKMNLNLFEGPGKSHAVAADFGRYLGFLRMVKDNFTEGELNTVLYIGRMIFIECLDIKKVENDLEDLY